MTLAAASPTPPAVDHRPGSCSDHPELELVTHRRAGVRWWYTDARTDLPTVCPSPDHDPYTRERCSWCGQTLDETGRGRPSAKRAFCRRRGDMCRIDAHRARRRGLAWAPAPIGGRR